MPSGFSSYRILAISDIHSNQIALEAVLEDSAKYGPYDLNICAGDVVGYGPDPNEVIQLVKDNFITVLGNHDRLVRDIHPLLSKSYPDIVKMLNSGSLIFNDEAFKAAWLNAKDLQDDSLAYLRHLDNKPWIHCDSGVAVVHGSYNGAQDGINNLKYEDKYILNIDDFCSAITSLSNLQNAQVGIFGHTHNPAYFVAWVHDSGEVYTGAHEIYSLMGTPKHGKQDLQTRLPALDLQNPNLPESGGYWLRKFLFNPGSVGQARHYSPVACYGIIQIGPHGKISLEFHSVDYNIAEVQKRMKKLNYPKLLISRLSLGS